MVELTWTDEGGREQKCVVAARDPEGLCRAIAEGQARKGARVRVGEAETEPLEPAHEEEEAEKKERRA